MHVGEGLDPPSLNIDGNAAEFADSFVYLGSTVTNNGDLTLLSVNVAQKNKLSTTLSSAVQSIDHPMECMA